MPAPDSDAGIFAFVVCLISLFHDVASGLALDSAGNGDAVRRQVIDSLL